MAAEEAGGGRGGGGLPRRPLRFVDNYTRLYALDVDGIAGHDQYVYAHGNGVVIIGAAPTHPAVGAPAGAAAGEGAEGNAAGPAPAGAGDGGGGGAAGGAGAGFKADFSVGGEESLQESAGGSGKRKRGAKVLSPDSPVCEVTLGGGAKVVLRSIVKGKLLEVNERLLEQPELLRTKPATEGFICIVQAFKEEMGRITQDLITPEEYEAKRGVPACWGMYEG